MIHTDHVGLLKPAELPPGGVWADLGAGTGAFTLALRELVGGKATIFAVDREGAGLDQLERAYASRFGERSSLQLVEADFSAGVDLPALDGALMANSLHFFRDKLAVLTQVRAMLKPRGLLLLVEYNVDSGNPWVPHPLSFARFRVLAPQAGFEEPRLLATHSSNFLREFYAASARNP